MKKLHVIPFGAVFAACLFPAVLSASMVNYVRPVVAIAQPTEDGSDSEIGGFIQIGGGDDHIDLSIEGGWLNFEPTVEVDEVYSGQAKYELVPLLATVKWRVNFDQAGKFSALIGPSAGLSYTYGRVNVFEDDVRIYRITDTEWVFTYGIDAQFRILSSKGVDLTLGYKFLIANSMVLEDENIRFDTGSRKSHILYAGLGFGF
jgi:hypothetical protein